MGISIGMTSQKVSRIKQRTPYYTIISFSLGLVCSDDESMLANVTLLLLMQT